MLTGLPTLWGQVSELSIFIQGQHFNDLCNTDYLPDVLTDNHSNPLALAMSYY